jgi:hypothetical protein
MKEHSLARTLEDFSKIPAISTTYRRAALGGHGVSSLRLVAVEALVAHQLPLLFHRHLPLHAAFHPVGSTDSQNAS